MFLFSDCEIPYKELYASSSIDVKGLTTLWTELFKTITELKPGFMRYLT